MYMNDREAWEFHNSWESVKASGTVTGVLGWYQERQLQFLMLARFADIIFSILTSQTENMRYLYLSGVFTGARRASISVDMLSKVIFIHVNSIDIHINHNTDIFQGPVQYLNIVIDLIEEDLEAETDDYNDE